MIFILRGDGMASSARFYVVIIIRCVKKSSRRLKLGVSIVLKEHHKEEWDRENI